MGPRTRTPILFALFALVLAGGVAGAVAWVHHQRVIDQANAERLRAEIEKDELARARDERIDGWAQTARRVREVMPLPDFWPASKYLWLVKQITVAEEKKWTLAQLRTDLKSGLAEVVAAAPQAASQEQHRWEQAGDIAFALLELPDADAYYHRALELSERANGHEESLRLNEKIADVLHVGGRAEDERSLREIVATLRRNSGVADPRPLIAATRLALCYRDLDRIPEAIALLNDAIKKAPIRAGADPEDMLGLLSVRSFLYRQSNQIPLCEEDVRSVLADSERIYGPEDPHTAIAVARQAIFLTSIQRNTEAELAAERARDLCEKNFGPNHPLTAVVLRAMAHLRTDDGKDTEAGELLQKILQIDEGNLPAGHPDIADDLMALAGVASRTNHLEEAQRLLRRALEIDEKSLGPNDAETALCRSNLASTEAELAKNENEKKNENTGGLPDPSLAGHDPKVNLGTGQQVQALDSLAVKLMNEGRAKEAEEKYREALALAEKQGSEDVLGLAAALRYLGGFLYSTQRYAAAEPLLVRALSLQEKKLGPRHPDLVPTLNVFAQLLIGEGRPTEGEQMLRRAIGLGVECDGVRDPEVARAMETLALYLQGNKRLPEALKIQREIVSDIGLRFGKENEGYAQALSNLAATLVALEHYDEAERVFDQVVAIGEKLPPDTTAMADWLNNFAVLRMRRHQKTEADFLYQRALGILFRVSSRTGTDPSHLQGMIGSYMIFLKSVGLQPSEIQDRLRRIRNADYVPAL